MSEAKPKGRMFTRFSPLQRAEHLVQIVVFSALVLTGIPQRYHESGWGAAIVQALGGIVLLQTIHRILGYIFVLEAVVHGIHLAYLLLKRKTTLFTMLPRWKDATDAVHMILYFLGFRPSRARFERYDFRQKVEYLALLWGGVVMIITGLMMLFPIETTRILPGEAIPIAKAAHSGEALLAALSILVWHMYGAHLCADVFPYDPTIFTGKISEERMHHEHPLELERILAAESQAKAATDGGAAGQDQPEHNS